MANMAGVRNGVTILDPYAGSCATLLAAAMLAPRAQTVAVEIAHNGLVNRDDIRRDFDTRNLTRPLALLQGDCTNAMIRTIARKQVRDQPFDFIITDPPYGIRESKNYNALTPIEELMVFLAHDRQAGTPLLRVGGVLVVFVPVTWEETIGKCLPSQDLMTQAGLVLQDKIEQRLNDKLSRWLVKFRCVG